MFQVLVLREFHCHAGFLCCDRYTGDSISDPVKSLPKSQQRAIEFVRDELNWLLRDEMASAMRLVVPVTATTLQKVSPTSRRADAVQMQRKVRRRHRCVFGQCL